MKDDKNYRPVNPNADILCAVLEILYGLAIAGFVAGQVLFWTLVAAGIAAVAAVTYWIWNHVQVVIT